MSLLPAGPFSGYRFGVNTPQTAGIVWALQWHEVAKDERVVQGLRRGVARATK